jgi:hypothetical protein
LNNRIGIECRLIRSDKIKECFLKIVAINSFLISGYFESRQLRVGRCARCVGFGNVQADLDSGARGNEFYRLVFNALVGLLPAN